MQPHDDGRVHDVSALSADELERARRDLAASLALARPGSPTSVPIMAHISAIDAEIAERGQPASVPCHFPQCRMFRPNGQIYCDEGRNCNG